MSSAPRCTCGHTVQAHLIPAAPPGEPVAKSENFEPGVSGWQVTGPGGWHPAECQLMSCTCPAFSQNRAKW